MLGFNVNKKAAIKEKYRVSKSAQLESYINKLSALALDKSYASPESSLSLPGDIRQAEIVKRVVEGVTGGLPLKHIVVVGIGGSNLGAMAVYDALRKADSPKMHFLDTVDANKLHTTVSELNTIEPESALILAISKSGTTTETIANLEILLEALDSSWSESLQRLIAITDEGSELWSWAEKKALPKLAIPEKVGGRYSVFSSVGLAPLYASGFDIDSLLHGARVALSSLTTRSTPVISALVLAQSYEDELAIHDTFLFEPRLESVGRWYRQLLAESIGKTSKSGSKVGITPTVSVGSVDLHSVAQLYLGGPLERITTFLRVDEGIDLAVPKERRIESILPAISGKSITDIMSAIYKGTCGAYEKQGARYMELTLPALDEVSIGELLQVKMIEVIVLAELLGVNAFNQPDVESYKIITREILRKK